MSLSSGKTRARGILGLAILPVLAGAAFGQTCVPNATALPLHSEGLAEKLGDVVISCSGGPLGGVATASVFVAYSATISSRNDGSGSPAGVAVTVGAGGSATSPTLNNPTLLFSNIRYTIPAGAVTITISGVRAAPPSAAAPSSITAAVTLTGVNSPAQGIPFVVGFASPSLLGTVFNNGLPCGGSPLPATPDFLTFASTTLTSFVRITESSISAFSVKDPDADSGARVNVRLSGYGSGVRAFVPDVIVGSTGSVPTSVASFLSGVAGGIYTPGSGQLLLVRVPDADANGAGGSPLRAAPVAVTSFTSVSELTVTNGSAFVVYEVMDANNSARETVQVPFFFVYAQNNCSTASQTAISATLGPVSTVTGPSATAPIPRFLSAPLQSDCILLNDCNAFYIPKLIVDHTLVTFNGSSLGPVQTGFLRLGNAGSGSVIFNATTTYTSGSGGWLTVSPTTGINNVTLTLTADPGALAAGTYGATVTIDAGTAGKATVLVTFNVGPAGTTIQGIVNAASFAVGGSLAPGSYAALFGLNLSGTNVGVTFNGSPATIVFRSATQINLLVPSTLSGQGGAAVVATVDGKQSNSYRVSLAPNAPGIFTPGIVNADGSINTTSQTAPLGTTVAIYLTGMTTPITGQVTVNIGGAQGIIPSFAGAQGTFPGLIQVNVQVPQTLSAGTLPVAVCIPGLIGQPVCSNVVNLYTR